MRRCKTMPYLLKRRIVLLMTLVLLRLLWSIPIRLVVLRNLVCDFECLTWVFFFFIWTWCSSTNGLRILNLPWNQRLVVLLCRHGVTLCLFWSWTLNLVSLQLQTEEKYQHYVNTLTDRIQTCDEILQQVIFILVLFYYWVSCGYLIWWLLFSHSVFHLDDLISCRLMTP